MMSLKATVALVAALAVVMVLAEDSCPPKYCEEIKVNCLTCNGTMMFLDVPNCGCCPQCIPYRGEGEPCDNEEEIALADKKTATSMKEPTKAVESGEKENQEKKEKKAPNICSPELTCLRRHLCCYILIVLHFNELSAIYTNHNQPQIT
ncbi:hypothetical protein LSTR_LSTR004966 [Laodelphax striatellus]|uniref:IGFBP N-terminal domain-containing protein n=1 Tax=Laodelphax striatellus TaxID=195883 RepID=A0A482XNG1_LAOST|nr:hypothetical protein LSTR_LSTR004966 [Laodelphax striatellus]